MDSRFWVQYCYAVLIFARGQDDWDWNRGFGVGMDQSFSFMLESSKMGMESGHSGRYGSTVCMYAREQHGRHGIEAVEAGYIHHKRVGPGAARNGKEWRRARGYGPTVGWWLWRQPGRL